jgi:acetyltransferase-like isoleucine patch superfamily enzyme
MKVIELMYRTPFGRVMSMFGRILARAHKPFMVYGYPDPATGIFRKWTRMSSTVTIMNPSSLSLGDHAWVWHYSIVDATAGVAIADGCQIGAWVGIFSHGSENSIRLLGEQFVHVPNELRLGYTRGAVTIGAYSFIGAGSIILPGSSIGKGCLISAGTIINKSIPDYSVVAGYPAEVKSRTVDLDRRFFRKDDPSDTYYDKSALAEIRERLSKFSASTGNTAAG